MVSLPPDCHRVSSTNSVDMIDKEMIRTPAGIERDDTNFLYPTQNGTQNLSAFGFGLSSVGFKWLEFVELID